MQTSVNESTLGNAASNDEEFTLQWGDDAPKGGQLGDGLRLYINNRRTTSLALL